MYAIVGCRQLVTLAGPSHPRTGAEMSALEIIPDGAMLVDQGEIVRVGQREEIEPLAEEQIDAGGRVVTPGLIDAHTHPVFGGTRIREFEMRSRGATYEEIAAAGGGIRSTVKATQDATEELLVRSAQRRAQWFLQHGTTTIEAKSGYGLTLDDELKILRVIRRVWPSAVPTFLGAHAIPGGVTHEEYVRHVVEWMLPAVARDGLARYCDVFVEQGYFTHDDARLIILTAKSLGLGARMHVDQLTNNGGAALASELGANTADHLEQTDATGIAALRAASVMPVLLPISVLALGKTRYPAARTMIEAGLPVVLATDFNPGSSPSPSLPLAMSLACTQMKMSPAESLTAVTVNAAYSLGMGASLGSLEAGKRADIVIWDCEDYREIAYWVDAIRPWRVIVGGQLHR